MKNLIKLTLIALIISFAFTSCNGGDDPNPTATCSDGIQNQGEEGIDCGGPCTACAQATENKTGSITANETWTNDRIWVLNQKVVVKNGVTLTIEPGTIIKGSEGQGSLASALVIERGGKLMAEGTASQPIIFTSISDNITVGQTAGTNLSAADNGLWGGLIVLGKAKGSFDGDPTEFNIEGIPADDLFGLYGGTDDADNSGVLKYISIRHGGAEIGEGNEINGLTLGAVGSGTVIDHIEIVANYDDGIEFFGGAVNASNVVIYGVGDDGLDIDQAYGGTITNAIVIQGSASGSGLEIDGREGTFERGFVIDQLTLIGNGSSSKIAEYKSKAYGETKNVFVTGWSTGSQVKISDAVSSQHYTDGDLAFTNWEVELPSGVTSVNDILLDEGNAASGFSSDTGFEAVTSSTTGADTSVFGWTYAKAQGAL